MSGLQFLLLNMRSKIEASFDYRKEHMYLVSSFPEECRRLLCVLLIGVLGYQMRKVSRFAVSQYCGNADTCNLLFRRYIVEQEQDEASTAQGAF